MRRFVFSLALCNFFLCFSVLSALRLPCFRERERERRERERERDNLSAFYTFVRFCLFPLPRVVLEGLRLVIVALPGLFYYPFWYFSETFFS